MLVKYLGSLKTKLMLLMMNKCKTLDYYLSILEGLRFVCGVSKPSKLFAE